MAIVLERQTVAKRDRLHGEESNHQLVAGRRLVFETSPDGEELLNEVVPAGKLWTVTISVSIDETDV